MEIFFGVDGCFIFSVFKKNDIATIGMNFVSGNIEIARSCLSQMTVDCKAGPLRILQRMRLEQSQLEGVQRKLQVNYL